MNKEYTQINDTDYIVSSDKGRIDLVKSNDNIEKILMKENEIETLNKRIGENNNILNRYKSRKKMQKNLYLFDLMLIIFVSSFLYAISNSSFISAIMMGTIIGLPCIIVTTAYGFLSNSYQNSNKTSDKIEADSHKVETLTKELEELKAKSNYQKMPYSETHINPMQQPTYGHSKNKVKRLVPNKDEIIS